MVLSVCLLVLSTQAPGPLDAFRANQAAIRVETEFVAEAGFCDRKLVVDGAFRDPERISFTEDPSRRVIGRWESDGEGVHVICERMPGIKTRPGSPGIQSIGQPPVECLFDGEVLIWHFLDRDDDTLQVSVTDEQTVARCGPFHWFTSAGFPSFVESDFKDIEPTRKTAPLGVYSTEVEVYRLEFPEGWSRLEVYYDPSIGYLPRYARIAGPGPGHDGRRVAGVKEMILVEARACGAGGFVPVEWYELAYATDDFDSLDRLDEDDGTILRPTTDRVAINHFKITKLVDRKDPVRLERLEGLRAVAGRGGIASIRGTPRSLRIEDVKSMLGRKMTAPADYPLPRFDSEEASKYVGPRGRSWLIPIVAGVAWVAAMLAFIRWRRARALAILAGLFITTGCGKGEGELVRLTASFTRPRLTYRAGDLEIPMTLAVRNEGNVSIALRAVNGGCTCRQVDQSKLPASLDPGNALKIPVRLHDRHQGEPKLLTFTLTTDRGQIDVPVQIHALPDHALSPSSIALSTIEGEEAPTFELTHREIYAPGSPRVANELRMPDGFSAIKVESRSGKIGGDPEYLWEDTVYRVKLEARTFGLNKETIDLLGADRQVIVQSPIVWKHERYLSPAPARAILGPRPVRVFLRCPDESVELTEVLSAPEGIKAVVSSTRELTVTLEDDAPGIIDGVVEVGTTAQGRDPLRIPVVRYAPEVRRADLNPTPSRPAG